MDWLHGVSPHWFWLTLGVFLAAAEMVVPGVFLIWMAAAALLTGLLAWVLPIGVPIQIVVFAVFAIVAVFLGRRYLQANPVSEADPGMNKRGARLAGQTARVVKAIEDGEGRIHHGDSEWIARGADAPVGAKVRITGADGAILLVEPLD